MSPAGVRFEGQLLQVIGLGSGQPTTVSLSTTSNLNATALLFSPRLIRVWSSVDCFIRFGGSSVVATTSDHPLTAKVPEAFDMAQNEFCAAIVSSGTGTLFISPLS